MSNPREPDYEPPWGKDGWPRVAETAHLDEDDRETLRQQLSMSPLERLRAMEAFVNDLLSSERQPE